MSDIRPSATDPFAGISRRRFLRASGTGLAALGGAGFLRAPRAHAGAQLSGRGRAKSVVILYLYGAPSQMDTLDPKPDAPLERRGGFKTISSSLPGVAVS